MSAFWDWAVDAYGRPGAADAFLALQDAHGQNVPLLLWALWRARTGAAPDPETLTRAAGIARAWEDAAVAPLRAARRGLKADLPGAETADREALRTRVKAVELEAERRLMLALEALGGRAVADRSAAALLALATEAWGAPLPGEAFAPLLAALDPVSA